MDQSSFGPVSVPLRHGVNHELRMKLATLTKADLRVIFMSVDVLVSIDVYW